MTGTQNSLERDADRIDRRFVGLGAIAVLIFGLAAASYVIFGQQTRQLRGTDLQGAPAPSFELQDSSGKQVVLEDYRGKVVVLTFLYTHCPDECPLIAENLRIAAEQIPNFTSNVAYVAVSLDPLNDTPDSVATFVRQHRIGEYMDYLIGSEDQLKPVWKSYYVYTETSSSSPSVLAHSTRVIILDRQGRQRVNLGSDFDPPDLAFDVKTLLAE